MEDGHFIDDPLEVVGVKPDFSGMGLKNKPEKPLKDCLTIQVSKEDVNSPDFNLYNFLNKKFKEAWLKMNIHKYHFPFNNVNETCKEL